VKKVNQSNQQMKRLHVAMPIVSGDYDKYKKGYQLNATISQLIEKINHENHVKNSEDKLLLNGDLDQ
ncbi:20821_t:CDS:2, partial [Dentiscutata erythropus]